MTASIAEAARHYTSNNLGEAARSCLEILRHDPLHFDAMHLLGVVCTNRGQHADAVSYLLRADTIRPGEGRLHANLGAAYAAIQRHDKALEAYLRAIALQFRDVGMLNNLGLTLHALDRDAEAIDAFRAALAMDPGYDPALFNLGRTRVAAGQPAAAEADFRLLLHRMPSSTSIDRIGEVTNELARLLTQLGRGEEALTMLRAAAAMQPDVPSYRWHEALLLLLLGRFDQAWQAYESRWDAPNHDRRPPDYRVLDLDRVAGQRVLVKEEQGRGDLIQFLRYMRPLADRGARIRLSVYQDLIPLALEIPGVELVLGPEDDETEYDVLTSLLSLPLAFRTTVETIPAQVPYLRVPTARMGRMRHHLGPASRRRIGLVWSGSPVSQPRAAIPAAMLEPLSGWQDVEFHCLQKELRPEDQAWLDQTGFITTHCSMLRDFGDTAALIDAMELVISIDTAVAHLAGALAKPVWIMLAFNPDWRWLLGRDDSPWYPTARLFRQPSPGDWPGVVRAIADARPF
jgi:tetratricopeptide (TPR) repeat protein